MAEGTQPKKKKRKWIIILLILIAVDLVLWAFLSRDNSTLAPDYAPVDEEQYAQDLGDGSDEKMQQEKGGGAVSLTYTTAVQIDAEKKQTSLYFANPSKSNQDIVLQVVVHDVVIAQSGKISPGKKVEKLDLISSGAKQLQSGGYDGEFVVLYYQPDTHEKTIVNTKIPVNITVE